MAHQAARRSTDAGSAAGAPSTPAASASSNFQSLSVFFDGATLQIRAEGEPPRGPRAGALWLDFFFFAIASSTVKWARLGLHLQ
jgi:hypothetical protein